MKAILSLLTASGILSLASAQVYTPPTTPSTPAGPPVDRAPASPAGQPAASPLGEEVPFLDPSTETIKWNGKTFSAVDNRVFTARFEKYLAEPPDSSAEAIEYRKTIDQILRLLGPTQKGGPKMLEAFKLLPRASGYPGDARLCDSLAQAIFVATQAKRDVRSSKALMAAMNTEQKRLIHNSDIQAGKTQVIGTHKNGKPINEPGKGILSVEYIAMQKRLAEIEALKKGHQAKSEVRVIQAKTEYQALMLQFFMQRRFEHVIMASRFYSMIWRDGDTAIHSDKSSDMSKFFNEGAGFSPTINTFDSLANEAIRDVNKGVKAFSFLVDVGELSSATKRLSETYALGEFMPAVATISYEKKRKIQLFVRKQIQLLAAIEARDFTRAKELVKNLQETTTDFDAARPNSAIAIYTRGSDLAIMGAKAKLAGKDPNGAMEEIKKAMELWPQNPKLKEFDHMLNQSSTAITARNNFDRLLSEKSYRTIFEQYGYYAAALANDPARAGELEKVVSSLREIEETIKSAEGLEKNGRPNAAWEQLVTLREEKNYENDPKLGREIADISSRVAPFANALQKAKDFETRNPIEIGSALSWYLKAQELHPKSDLAKSGITRMLDAAEANQ